jgi:hypothetical protein
MRATVGPSACHAAARHSGSGTELRPADDPVARLAPAQHQRPSLVSASFAGRGRNFKIGHQPARRKRIAMRPLPWLCLSLAGGVGPARELVPRHAGLYAGAKQRRGRAEHLRHVRQPPPDPRPPRGSPNDRVKVTASPSREPALRRPLRGPEAVVRARGYLPSGGGRASQPALKDPTPIRTAIRFLTQPAVP